MPCTCCRYHEPADVTIPVTMSTSDTGWDDIQQVAVTIPSPTPHIQDRRLPLSLCLKCGVLYLPLEELADVRSWINKANQEAAFRSQQAAQWEAQQAAKKASKK